MKRSALVTLLILTMLLPSSIATSQVTTDANRLGQVSFATSCTADAQTHFTRGVALLHSFGFDAHQGLTKPAQADPTCGIAHWGSAVAWLGNPLGGAASPTWLKDGSEAAAKAKATGAATPRERD